jgi:hypothetical protein
VTGIRAAQKYLTDVEAIMLKIASAGMIALAVITGSTLASAQTPSGSQRITAADLNALTEARVATVKDVLQLTADQEKYWPAIEEAFRSRAKERQTRLANAAARRAELGDRSRIEIVRDRNPIEFLNRRSDALAQRAAEFKKLADAWQPLYQTLSADQKRRLGFLAVYTLREVKDALEQRRNHDEDDEEDSDF